MYKNQESFLKLFLTQFLSMWDQNWRKTFHTCCGLIEKERLSSELIEKKTHDWKGGFYNYAFGRCIRTNNIIWSTFYQHLCSLGICIVRAMQAIALQEDELNDCERETTLKLHAITNLK